MAERFFYMQGQATPDLHIFTTKLFAILAGSAPSLRWRTDETQRWYVKFNKAFGEERIARQINGRMFGHTMALFENDFSYNNIMPFGGYDELTGRGLIHYCLFSKEEALLVPEKIDKVVSINFPAKPALIFMHDDTHTSVKRIKHAHIVVDLESNETKLKQRYFDKNDFSK